jgi:hypothetical protein
MARATIYLTNGNEVKKVPVGFSWTMFFWGFFVPLIRADWLWAIAMFILAIFFWWLPAVVMAFFYNKIYLKSLFDKGYKIHDSNQVSDAWLKTYLGYINLPGKEE